jgi:hypothetical protein
VLQFVEKLFFGGRQLTREVELLNAKQAHAVSTVLDDHVDACVCGKIRFYRYLLSIARDSRLAALAFTGQQAGAIFFESLFKVVTSLGVG